MATDTLTTGATEARKTWRRGPAAYLEARSRAVKHPSGSLHGLLVAHGFTLAQGREALTGATRGERSMQVLKLLEAELGLEIDLNDAAA